MNKGKIRILISLFVLVVLIFPLGIVSSWADLIQPLDDCFGVDHPPFEDTYEGDGYSYLRFGMTLPLDGFNEGDEFLGQLAGGSGDVSSSATLSSEGQLFYVFPLYSYGSYTIKIFDPNGDMIYTDDLLVDASEPSCSIDNLMVAPPILEEPEEEVTEEEEEEELTQPEPEEETTEETSTEEEEVSEPAIVDDTNNFWPLLFITGGLSMLIGGIVLFLKKDCEKERKAWLAAVSRAASATAKTREAEQAAELITAEKEQLEESLEEIRDIYPSAGKPDGGEAWVEMDGKRITSRDVAMRREAERAAWDKYRDNPNPDTAEELVEDWEEAATPQSEEERRELDEQAKELDDAIKELSQKEKDALDKVKDAKEAEKKALKEADMARLLYEACMKKALAPKGTSTPGTSGGSPGGTSIETGENKKQTCSENDPPQERNRKKLGNVRIPIELDVSFGDAEAHKAALKANEISGKIAGVSKALGIVSKMMDIKGVGQALVRDGVGWSLVKAGAPPATGQALDIPVPTSPGQLAVDVTSLLGKASSTIISMVLELQERRLNDCDMSAKITSNVFSAECVEIWKCKNGTWVKDHSRFTLTFIGKRSRPLFKRSAVTWAQGQKIAKQYERKFNQQMNMELKKLEKFESGCK